MKKIALSIAVLATFMAAEAASADVIHFTPGPYGGSKIITPWGDFIAIPSGNSIWIGTVEEYMDNKADAVASESGFKRARIQGEAKNERNYVLAKALSTSVGKTDLHQITTSVLFGVGPSKKEKRPPKSRDSEYVSVVWTPSNNTAVSARIVSADGRKAYSPNDCGKAGWFSYCEFTVTRQDLVVPMMYVFTTKRQRPAAIVIESVAKQHYKDIKISYSTALRGIEPGSDKLEELQHLHEIDESIPTSLK